MAIQALRDMADWLVDATRLEFDPSQTGGGGAVNSVGGTLPIISSGGANPVVSLVTPLDPAYGGTGVASPTAGYVKANGGSSPFTTQAVPIPPADGGTGIAGLPANKDVLTVQAGVVAGDNNLTYDPVTKSVGIGLAGSSPLVTVDAITNVSVGSAVRARANGFGIAGMDFTDATGGTQWGAIGVTSGDFNINGPIGGWIDLNTRAKTRGLNTTGFIATRYGVLPVTNGLNNDLNVLTTYNYVSGNSAAFTVTGFANSADGNTLRLYVPLSFPVTVAHDNANSSISNRIYTPTSADETFVGPCVLDFVYDFNSQRWILIDLVSPGGYVKRDGSLPLTGDWNNSNFIRSANSMSLFNVVSGYGADSGGTVDCKTAVNAAISAATSAGGGIVYFPPGTYRVVQSGATVPFIVGGQIHILGAGRGVSNISFEPATGGACFQINNTGTEINYNRVSDISFRSPDYVTQKTMIQIYDCNNVELERISNTPGTMWCGAGSIGFQYRGRQELRTRDCEINADFPTKVSTDPNIASISFDHSSIEQCDLLVTNIQATGTFAATTVISSISPALPAVNMAVGWTVKQGATTATVASNTTTTITLTAPWGGATGSQSFATGVQNYCTTVDDNVVLTNCAFKKLAWVCGIGGFTYNNTTSAVANQIIEIENVRTEQAIISGNYGIDIRSTSGGIQGLSIKHALIDATGHGVRLTNCKWPSLQNVVYGGTNTFLNLSATVTNFRIEDSFYQSGSTITDSSTLPVAFNLINGANPPFYCVGSLTKAPFTSDYYHNRETVINLSTGDNNNVATTTGWVLINGPGGAFAITGLSGGIEGKEVTFVNNTAQIMTVKFNNAGSSAGNKIALKEAADTAVGAAYGWFKVKYASNLSIWVVTGHS